jgi:hypothetical protein
MNDVFQDQPKYYLDMPRNLAQTKKWQ